MIISREALRSHFSSRLHAYNMLECVLDSFRGRGWVWGLSRSDVIISREALRSHFASRVRWGQHVALSVAGPGALGLSAWISLIGCEGCRRGCTSRLASPIIFRFGYRVNGGDLYW